MIFQINVDFSKVLLVTSALVTEQNNSRCHVPIKALNTANGCFLTLVFISSAETQQRLGRRIKLLLHSDLFDLESSTCHCGFGLCVIMLKLKEARGEPAASRPSLSVGPGCLVVSPCRGSAV